jgi:hypothetical protein
MPNTARITTKNFEKLGVEMAMVGIENVFNEKLLYAYHRNAYRKSEFEAESDLYTY